MQDIKRRDRKKNNKVMRKSPNSSDVLIKKIIISILILAFIGIVIFSFFWENKDSRQITIEIPESEYNNEENIAKNDATDKKINQENASENEIATEENVNANSSVTSEEAKKIIESKAKESIIAIKNKDFKALAELTHSEHELVFSPYANFNNKNKSFSQDKIKNISTDSKKYIWGEYNGLATGQIEMTFADYYKLFIYDQDFSNAEKISYNEDSNNGKIKNNSSSFFDNSITVEYYFSGFDPELKEKDMDWRSLRLVFIDIDGEWYLKGISHDELTI